MKTKTLGLTLVVLFASLGFSSASSAYNVVKMKDLKGNQFQPVPFKPKNPGNVADAQKSFGGPGSLPPMVPGDKLKSLLPPQQPGPGPQGGGQPPQGPNGKKGFGGGWEIDPGFSIGPRPEPCYHWDWVPGRWVWKEGYYVCHGDHHDWVSGEYVWQPGRWVRHSHHD